MPLMEIMMMLDTHDLTVDEIFLHHKNFFFFLVPHPRHMEFQKLEGELEL